jgi:GNAT superfamily N-acetyltransferase
MEIAGLTVAQLADYLALVNAEIRPQGSRTSAGDDFPLALDRANLPWLLGASDPAGRLAGGLAILVRSFATSCGDVRVGAVGSVVTRPDCRGQGLSARLQAAAVALLRREGVPLAALWTDRPEIYAGRGFRPAGWEWHAGLLEAALPAAPPPGVRLRDWTVGDTPAVAGLYDEHRWRTRREPGDAARLYGMPGTRGLVAETSGGIRAAVFCGKGADFPDYVAEWSGDLDLVLCLLEHARAEALATAVLLPAGSEALVARLGAAGASPVALPSACWAVLGPDRLADLVTRAGGQPPAATAPAGEWLGEVGPDGSVRPGAVTVAVWGFDSA